MITNPRGQQEIHKYLRQKESQNLKTVQQNLTEGEALEIIRWADLPTTKLFGEYLKKFEATVNSKLDASDWDFPTGRGLCFLRNYLGILDRFVVRAKKNYKQIQDRKSKEG